MGEKRQSDHTRRLDNARKNSANNQRPTKNPYDPDEAIKRLKKMLKEHSG